jgi:hypothetical protein
MLAKGRVAAPLLARWLGDRGARSEWPHRNGRSGAGAVCDHSLNSGSTTQPRERTRPHTRSLDGLAHQRRGWGDGWCGHMHMLRFTRRSPTARRYRGRGHGRCGNPHVLSFMRCGATAEDQPLLNVTAARALQGVALESGYAHRGVRHDVDQDHPGVTQQTTHCTRSPSLVCHRGATLLALSSTIRRTCLTYRLSSRHECRVGALPTGWGCCASDRPEESSEQ